MSSLTENIFVIIERVTSPEGKLQREATEEKWPLVGEWGFSSFLSALC